MSTDTPVVIRPSFYCPLPASASHPAAAEIDHEAVSWLYRMRLGASDEHRRQLARANFGLLSALATPDGITERVQWAADFLYWGFALDDARDEAGRPERLQDVVVQVNKMQRILEVPDTTLLSGEPLADGLRLLQHRFISFATPTQVRRYQEGMRTYYFSVLWEITSRNSGAVLSLDEYSAMRMKSAGHPPMTAMLEAINGYALADRDLDSPAVRALTEMNWLLVAWDNDLYSYGKEAGKYRNGNNLVDVLAMTQGLSAQEAMDEALRLRDRVLCLFLKLQRRLLADAGLALSRYIVDLGIWIRANIEWGTSSARYTGSTAGSPGVWAEQPHDSDPSPLDLPSIRWWWTVY